MPIKLCRECGHQVSTEAPSCPKCGVPDPARPLAEGESVTPEAKAQALSNIGCVMVIVGAAVLALLAVILVAAGVLFGDDDDSTSDGMGGPPPHDECRAAIRGQIERQPNLDSTSADFSSSTPTAAQDEDGGWRISGRVSATHRFDGTQHELTYSCIATSDGLVLGASVDE